MLMKDIKVGEEYAASEWGQLDHVDLFLSYGRADSEPPDGNDWARDWREALRKTSLYAQRVRVIEKGVQIGNYSRPGVLVQKLDRETGEPLEEPVTKRAVQLAMKWDRLASVYHDVLAAYEEDQVQMRRQREQRQREEKERHAREWMERVFEEARSTLNDIVALGSVESFTDENVKALVELRYPEGNPYEVEDED